jgi:pimeloyl-ACP methyl ester carboxylesterase
VGIIGLSVVFTAIASAQVTSPAGRPNGPKPTVVIVHGAWADASGFSDVITSLQHQGYTVIAPANPLRGLASDSAYISSVLNTLSGPLVVVGHSYGGAVITNAATGNPNVKALVYVAAFVPDQGQTLLDLVSHAPGSQLVPPGLPGATQRHRYHRRMEVREEDMVSQPADEIYVHGYSEEFQRYHSSRTLTADAPFIVPYLHPGQTLLDCGCGPGVDHV